ncbi:MAG: PKD domain-containing protein [Nitrososphaera sp.]
MNSRDSFRVKLPEGWIIQDIKNTGYTLAAEELQGYGLLAELCRQPRQQQQYVQSMSSNFSTSTSTSNRYTGSCQNAQGELIHIIRYPNLGARLGISSDEDAFTFINSRVTIPNAILTYHLQRLQEVGYHDFRIINSMDSTINVDNSTSLNNRRITTTTTTIPAKLVEMTYTTSIAPNETKTGYFLLTATAETPRNLGVLTGYSVFCEGNFTSAATNTTTATATNGDEIRAKSSIRSPSASSLTPIALPAQVRQVFDSFELVSARTEPLTVQLTSEETEGIAPATFEFEAQVTGGMAPYTISWNFGDGRSWEEGVRGGDEEENDRGEHVEHTFEVNGTYNARVSVTDTTGRTASDSIPIIVDEPPPLRSVDIISNATAGIAPATFEFEANVTGGIEPYTYRWNFGDGSAESNTQTVLHTFDQAGRYIVPLIVTDSQNHVALDRLAITVEEAGPPPSATTTAEEGEDPTLANQDRNSGTDGLSELDAILNNLEQK